LRARLATARTIAKKLNHLCLKVVNTPATIIREKEMGQQSAEPELAHGVQDDEIAQETNKEAREAGFIGPKMPGMES
jgi:hypothetical protein